MHRKRYLLAAGIVLAGSGLAFWGYGGCSIELTQLAAGRATLLLYAHLSNRVLVVERGRVDSISTDRMGPSLGHHADPALSPDGTMVSFVRRARSQRGEEIILYNRATATESLLLERSGSVYSLAWSPRGGQMAFVADKGAERAGGRGLFVVDLRDRQVQDIVPQSSEVAPFSRPAWSPDGLSIAFEERPNSADGGDHPRIVRIDVASRSLTAIGDGWFPSWSPDGTRIAYVDRGGARCLQADPSGHHHSVLWWSLRTLLLDDIIAPPVWSPAGQDLVISVTSGVSGDGRITYRLNLASDKTCRLQHDPAFAVVAWSDTTAR